MLLRIHNTIHYLSYLVIPVMEYLIFQYNNINKALFYPIMALLILFIYVRFIEPNILVTAKHNIKLKKNKKLRIAILSDLHLGARGNYKLFKKAIDKINNINIDLLFLTGDFVWYPKKDKLREYFKILRDIKMPSYAVTGNHDHGLIAPNNNSEPDVALELIKIFKENNINVINDKKKILSLKGIKIFIAGLSDYWLNKANYKILNKNTGNNLFFVLTHNPDSIYRFPNSNPDLVIAGHTHGGQVRIPPFYRKFINSEYNFDKGFYNVKNMKLFISSGLGLVGLPFRFLVPPKLDIIEII